jgi:spore germination protein KB
MKTTIQKISHLQFFMMMIGFITPFGHFIYIKLAYTYSGRDSWISLVCSSVLGAIIIFSQLKSSADNSDHSLIALSAQAFGKWFGKIIGFLYICFFLLACSISLHVLTQFMNLLFPMTPSAVFSFCVLFTIAYVTYSGSEVLTRTIQLALPLLMLLGMLISILILKERDLQEMLPIMENGIFPIGKGSIIFLMMFAELVVFRMLTPTVNQPESLPKKGLWYVAIILLMFLGPTTGPIMVFGEDLAKETLYPTFEELRYIQLFDFIERLDVLGIFLWVIGSFIRSSIFLFGAAKGLAESFQANRENLFVLPAAFLVFALDISLKSYTPEKVYHFLVMDYSVIAITMGILLPLFVDLTVRVRQRWKPVWNGGKEI